MVIASDDEAFTRQGMSRDRLDDADLASLEGMWSTSDGEVITASTVTDLAAPTSPTTAAGAAQSASAAEGGLETTPSLGVFPWRSAPPEEIAGQWAALRAFVEWIVQIHRFETAEHRPCWWAHTEMVQEWAALRHLYDVSWDRENEGDGPNNFHYWLDIVRKRLQSAWARHPYCKGGNHGEPEVLIPQGTVIDGEQWAALTGTDAAYERPTQWPWQAPSTKQTEQAEKKKEEG